VGGGGREGGREREREFVCVLIPGIDAKEFCSMYIFPLPCGHLCTTLLLSILLACLLIPSKNPQTTLSP
jgi:hypothetical protein